MEQDCADNRGYFLKFVVYSAFQACKHRKKGVDEPGVTIEELRFFFENTVSLPTY